MREEYKSRIKGFYTAHLKSAEKANAFFDKVAEKTNEDHPYGIMMNQIERFVSLSNLMRVDKQGDALSLFFLRTCMESLAYLAKLDNKSFFELFEECFSDSAKDYIFRNLSISVDLGEDFIVPENNCTIDIFLKLVKLIRDSAVHCGNCWSCFLFLTDEDPNKCASLSILQTSERIPIIPKDKTGVFTYSFSTKLFYSVFIDYFVEACVCFVEKMMLEQQ